MSRLVVFRGLQGSGKSTEAKKLVEASGNAVRLNKDLLRTMLHFDKWNGKNEGLTQDAQIMLAQFFLKTGKKVIIDDTNLHPKTINQWKDCGKLFDIEPEFIMINTPLEECIARDALRTGKAKVGKDVIVQTARQYGLYPFEKPDVIVDIDGTLADITHRRHFVQGEKKDWNSFFGMCNLDKVRYEVRDKVDELAKDYNIVLVSGRPEDYRKVTEHWLDMNGIPYETLIMRRSGDSRPDDIIKKEILDKYFKRDNIHLVIDDRPRVIRMWRENGLDVMDVGDGVEF